MGPEIAIPLASMTMVVVLALGIPFVRALSRRWEHERLQPNVPSEVIARLERIEQAVDAVAVEVERISEGQRFTTKLLSERGSEDAPALRGRSDSR